MTTPPARVRVAAMSDVHCTKTSTGVLQPVFTAVAEHADILVLCGDLTDYGLSDEARVLVHELSTVRIPVVAVLGNHDYESGEEGEVSRILTDSGVRVLDGGSCEILGVGFAGTKGFCGGFGPATLGAWGERSVKSFVNEAVAEALKLETALARLRTETRIAVLHYSPIRATVVGEPLEIFPFLGCGRLEEPLTRFPVAAVVHGHAHNGTHEGATTAGVPVYNVAMPLMKKLHPDELPARIIEIAVPGGTATSPAPGAYAGLERRAAGSPPPSTATVH